MKRERKSVITLILYGITGLLWAALCVRDGIGGTEGFLRLACAVLWCFGFWVQLRRVRKKSDKDDLN